MTLSARRFIRAPADEAWELISRTGSWPLWGPSVSAVHPVDETLTVGMRGRVRTPVGIWLPFHITSCDPPHSWAWSVLSIPATTHSVEPVPGGCRISFSVPAPALPYLVVCRVALTRIAALLESSDMQPPPPTSDR
jgi:hypothetical protein